MVGEGVDVDVVDVGVGADADADVEDEDEDVDRANWKLSRLPLGKRFAQGQNHDPAVIRGEIECKGTWGSDT